MLNRSARDKLYECNSSTLRKESESEQACIEQEATIVTRTGAINQYKMLAQHSLMVSVAKGGSPHVDGWARQKR